MWTATLRCLRTLPLSIVVRVCNHGLCRCSVADVLLSATGFRGGPFGPRFSLGQVENGLGRPNISVCNLRHTRTRKNGTSRLPFILRAPCSEATMHSAGIMAVQGRICLGSKLCVDMLSGLSCALLVLGVFKWLLTMQEISLCNWVVCIAAV